jgi:DNA-binding IclR family transcriptional regulator
MKHIARIAPLSKYAKKPRLADDSPATETVDLSLRLLERLASSSAPIGVSELAREFDASKATVYRHLQALVLHGFVRQEPTTMRYAAGIKLFILGERLRERFDILAVAREEMLPLRDETGQTATLSALIEDQVIFLEVLPAHAIVNFGVPAGTVLEFHSTAHGKVALAFGPERLLSGCLAQNLKARTPHTICSPNALRRAVAQVRSRGWATAPNQFVLGLNGLAAPIFNHVGDYAGSLAIGGSIQYIPASPPQEQIRAVTQTAERISRKLGWGFR